MQRILRQAIVSNLWGKYRQQTLQIQKIEEKLFTKGIDNIYLDHFAVIDLPGTNSGIQTLKQIFTTLGFELKGEDYLADKQNPFAWLSEKHCENNLAKEALPQVVVADFRLSALPPNIKEIVEKYASHARPPLFLKSLEAFCANVKDENNRNDKKREQKLNVQNEKNQNDKRKESKCEQNITKITDDFTTKTITQFTAQISQYFFERSWPLPTVSEFKTVQAFNELLAWVLVFGRRPNHFTISVHLLDHFSDLHAFSHFVEEEVKLPLNQDGGHIKGGEHAGIAQGSTIGMIEKVALSDGCVDIATGFVEFVWRYPQLQIATSGSHQKLWRDYFTGFIAAHANQVIESLYTTHSR